MEQLFKRKNLVIGMTLMHANTRSLKWAKNV